MRSSQMKKGKRPEPNNIKAELKKAQVKIDNKVKMKNKARESILRGELHNLQPQLADPFTDLHAYWPI